MKVRATHKEKIKSKSNMKLKEKKGKIFQEQKPSEEDSVDFLSENGNYNSSPKWYEEVKYSGEVATHDMKYDEIDKLKRQADAVLNDAVILNNSKTPKSLSNSDYAWIKTVMARGTKTDRVAAYTLLIQDAPLYNLSYIKHMVDMVKVGKNKECFMAVDTLSELFLNDLLPPNRKLLLFNHQPLSKLDELTSGNVVARKRRLLLWCFEDQLKSTYGDFVNSLNKIAHDSVDANKEKAITVMCKLLTGNPERESVLLNNIVNKLGDPSHKVGSKVIYALTKLLETHPNMREVVIEAVEKVIFRSNISKRAQYYSVCFLSQFCLSSDDGKIAKRLITIYLSLFKACIKTGDVDSRMMSALLTGVNRAYPFAKKELGMMKDHIDTIYKVIHLTHANVAVQALSLVYLICDYSNAFIDRFYTVLYKKVGEPEMFACSHHAMLISLIFRALKKDKEKIRISAFIKRLLQMCSYIPIPVACGILVMISEILRTKEGVLTREVSAETIIKLEDDSDDGEEHYEDVKEEEVPLNETPVEEVKETKPVELNNLYNICNIEPPETAKVWSNPDKSVGRAKDAEVKNYDPFVRNPLYAGANRSICHELFKLASHFHPTISLFANKLINGEKIVYSGDPLIDFTLIRFLDKFSFKNPKEIKNDEDKSLTFSKFGRKKYYSSATVRRLRANTAAYLNHSEKNIPADEIFLYRYMKEKFEKQPITKEDDSDMESVGSDEFEEMLSGVANESKEDINFMDEVGKIPKKTKKKGKEESESESELESDPDVEDDDHENYNEASDDGSLAEEFDGDEIDEEFRDDDVEMQGSDIDEAELEASFAGFDLSKIPILKKGKDKSTKKGKGDFKNKLFASADEFSELLEDTDMGAGSSEAFSNKDKAAAKQLKWESDRDKWINKKNFRSKSRKHPFKKNKSKKPPSKGGKRKRF